jgi:hypothetical protein
LTCTLGITSIKDTECKFHANLLLSKFLFVMFPCAFWRKQYTEAFGIRSVKLTTGEMSMCQPAISLWLTCAKPSSGRCFNGHDRPLIILQSVWLSSLMVEEKNHPWLVCSYLSFVVIKVVFIPKWLVALLSNLTVTDQKHSEELQQCYTGWTRSPFSKHLWVCGNQKVDWESGPKVTFLAPWFSASRYSRLTLTSAELQLSKQLSTKQYFMSAIVKICSSYNFVLPGIYV